MFIGKSLGTWVPVFGGNPHASIAGRWPAAQSLSLDKPPSCPTEQILFGAMFTWGARREPVSSVPKAQAKARNSQRLQEGKVWSLRKKKAEAPTCWVSSLLFSTGSDR